MKLLEWIKVNIVRIMAVLFALFAAIQLVPYGRDHSNPPVTRGPAWDSPRTGELFFRACKDCHSNETAWPWYGGIAPFSWLVQYDVDEGRSELNISEWRRSGNKGDETAGEVREGEMPPWYYLLAHPEARLSQADRQELIRGLVLTFGEKHGMGRDD